MSASIGQPVPRLEDQALLTGNGRYVDDIASPGALHAAFVRSPHAHALIQRIDAAAARKIPGVHAVFTIDDLAPALTRRRMSKVSNSGSKLDQSWPFVLADGEVSYVGEPVAIVVADSRYIAEDAAAAVVVDYDVLPAAADCRTAALTGAVPVRRELAANQIMSYRVNYGEVDAAFAKAAHVFRDELWIHRGGSHSIEGRGILAEYSDRAIEVWASTQKAHDMFHTLADLLDLNENRLRVATPDVGGGFGPKLCTYPEDVSVVAAAKLLRRSVKWIEDRREHFTNAVHERDQYWTMEIAVDAEARVLGVRGRILHDVGAYAMQDVNLPYNSATSVSGTYMVPALQMDVIVTHTNKTPVSSVRGAGYPQAAFAIERMFDRVARELKLDRAEVRRRNLIPTEKMPYKKPLKARSGEQIQYDSGDYPGCQAEVLQAGCMGHIPAAAGCGARRWPLSRHRAGARPQGHWPWPVRSRRRAGVADRPHLGADRRRRDGPGPRDRAGADCRRAVRRAGAGYHRRFRRHVGDLARPRRFRQPADGHRRLLRAHRGEGRHRQGAQARQPPAGSRGG